MSTESHFSSCLNLIKMSEICGCVPQDCGRSIDILNLLQEDLISDVCHNVLSFMHSRASTINLQVLLEKSGQSDVHINEDELQSIVNVIKHIYRSAAKHVLQHKDLKTQLDLSLKFSEKCSECIANCWSLDKQDGNSPKLEDSLMFGVGRLVDMQWKLGVAVSSDSCKNLNTTFVSMTVKVADTSGQLTTHAFEMTVPQFKNLSKQFQEIARHMETPNF